MMLTDLCQIMSKVTHTREHAHRLIDRTRETQIAGLVQFLETIVDPVAGALRSAALGEETGGVSEGVAVHN